MIKKRLKDFSVTIPFKSQKVEAKTMHPTLGREDCIPNNGCKVTNHNCPTTRKGGELAPARPAGGPKGLTTLHHRQVPERVEPKFPLRRKTMAEEMYCLT